MPEVTSEILSIIHEYSKKPELFEPGETRFWDDVHISKSMLEAHLNPDHDMASRKAGTIDREIENLVSSGILKNGDRVLDLGCGPGLHASRLAERGVHITGIDISQRSLDYARQYASEKGLVINYRCLNFFDIDYSREFDAILQSYGELGTFSDSRRDELLSRLYEALIPGGLLIFDVTTRAIRKKDGTQSYWYMSDGGFWRPGKHLVLEQGFDYPENDVRFDQYIIIDDEGITLYRTWAHDYSPRSISQVLEKAGFSILHIWNDLTGTPYKEGGEWIAVVGKKQ